MQDKLKKVKLKGNESFNFREGWLRKGMRCVKQDPSLFSRDDVMGQLGVGSKMVKSIKFWLQATELCEEKYISGRRGRALYITKDLGEIIDKYDPFFDDIFTLFVLHYHIVSNESLCIVWNIFFNDFSGVDFTRNNMVAICEESLQKKLGENTTFSMSLFEDDCASVLRMYQVLPDVDDPEESLQCPLNSLGLVLKSSKLKNAFVKSSPTKDVLDKLAVFYVIIKNIPEGKNSASIKELVESPNNIGKVFNLSRVKVNEYLDQLRVAGYITVNRTAGLDMVYLNTEYKPSDVLEEYYKKAQAR